MTSKPTRADRDLHLPGALRCSGKVAYDKKGAQSAKNLRYKQDHVQLRIYSCPKCNMWHLTSKI